MNFSTFLKESVTAKKLFNFYALSLLSSKYMLHSSPYDKEEAQRIQRRYAEISGELWEDLCADGIMAVIREGAHGSLHAYPVKKDYLRPSEHEMNVETWVGTTSLRCLDVLRAFHAVTKGEKRSNVQYELSEVVSKIEEIFKTKVNKVLRFLLYLFGSPRIKWDDEYGGAAWADITRTVIKFYEKGKGNASEEEIDHYVDQVHNLGTWLNKFPNFRTVQQALNRKRYANYPNEYLEELEPDVREWIVGLRGLNIWGKRKEFKEFEPIFFPQMKSEPSTVPKNLVGLDAEKYKRHIAMYGNPKTISSWKRGPERFYNSEEHEIPWLEKASFSNDSLIKIIELSYKNTKHVVWISGRWEEGDWYGYVWTSGFWMDGVWHKGNWLAGFWQSGIWLDGIWFDGFWVSGEWKGGEWQHGYIEDNGKYVESVVDPKTYWEQKGKK